MKPVVAVCNAVRQDEKMRSAAAGAGQRRLRICVDNSAVTRYRLTHSA